MQSPLPWLACVGWRAQTTDTSLKLFVGQIPRAFSESDLRPFFEEFGAIADLSILKDRYTGLSRGESVCGVFARGLGFPWRDQKARLFRSFLWFPRPGCAFLTFVDRASAEPCIAKLHDQLILPGVR